MPDRPKPAIPAWQRVQQPSEAKDAPGQDAASEEAPKAPQWEEATPSQPSSETTTPELSSTESTAPSEQEAPTPAPATLPTLSTNDFEAFQKQQRKPAVAIQQPAPRSSGPPIITYPEFLVEAHKPPPLITLSRIWNTAYFASGITAFLYGASKYLVEPMADSLNHSRHDFAVHSLSKVDEFNARLSKLVSKVPEPKKDNAGHEAREDEDTTSEASDPAELFHRNVGTQTSPPSSRENSMIGTEEMGKRVNLPIDYQENGLKILKQHITDMLERSTNLESAHKARHDKMSNLQSYIDTLIYASPTISTWASADHGLGAREAEGDGSKGDGVDELKKEIRAVKGLMLSAKRFPGVAGRAAGAS